MPAYIIAMVNIKDPQKYREYAKRAGPANAKHGSRFLVRGGKHESKEGTARARNVVLEFKDYETALACYNSPEYARLIAIRKPHADADILVIEGYDGEQP